jgi:hypothetical protein
MTDVHDVHGTAARILLYLGPVYTRVQRAQIVQNCAFCSLNSSIISTVSTFPNGWQSGREQRISCPMYTDVHGTGADIGLAPGGDVHART